MRRRRRRLLPENYSWRGSPRGRLPGRPAIRFLWMYLVKRGFLDGKQGRVYCQLLAVEEALINAKLLELELEQNRVRGKQGAGRLAP
jgi:hypothetical protein